MNDAVHVLFDSPAKVMLAITLAVIALAWWRGGKH
jgi:hypothetical protein